MPGEQPVAVITHANPGIGREVARRAAARHGSIVVGSRDLGNGERAACDLDPSGRHVHAQQLDVADPTSITAAADRVRRNLGRVDVLVNNAAIDTDARAITADLHRIRRDLEANLFGVLGHRASLPATAAGQSASADRQRLERRRLHQRDDRRHPRLLHLQSRPQRAHPAPRRRTAP
jgi:NAD(P)-dependent dehydrogenase (short-subunit alcohol dehydrogenase family)